MSDAKRCPVCDWPLATEAKSGCVIGNCCYRPSDPDEQRRIAVRREQLDRVIYLEGSGLLACPAEVLAGEITRLRGLLDQCWEAAGLLGSGMTGQPFQAWEEPSDLVAQIGQLWSDAENYREAEKEDA